MLHAVLNGKVTNREIGEDVLTSTVFGILKHLPVQEVWLPILERAQDRHSKRECSLAQCIRERAGVRAEDYVRAHVTFWPQLADFGEPDLVVTFTGADSSSSPPPLACVIEVKLWSPKSGGKDDQLHKYFRALHSPQLACATEGRRAMPLGLVYLTALEASADVDESRGNWPDGDSRLFQCFELAWQDVTDVLCDCAHKLIGKGQLAAMTEDLTAFLKKMTLSRFTGFEELSIENFSDSWDIHDTLAKMSSWNLQWGLSTSKKVVGAISPIVVEMSFGDSLLNRLIAVAMIGDIRGTRKVLNANPLGSLE